MEFSIVVVTGRGVCSYLLNEVVMSSEVDGNALACFILGVLVALALVGITHFAYGVLPKYQDEIKNGYAFEHNDGNIYQCKVLYVNEVKSNGN